MDTVFFKLMGFLGAVSYEKLTYTVLTEYSFKCILFESCERFLDNLIGCKNSEELRPKFIIVCNNCNSRVFSSYRTY